MRSVSPGIPSAPISTRRSRSSWRCGSALTRSTPATASCRRTLSWRARARPPGSSSSARRRRCSAWPATRRVRATAARAADVPVLDASEPVENGEEAMAAAEKIGFPVFVKASHGGGGRGMRLVTDPAQLARAVRGGPQRGGGRVRRRHRLPRAGARAPAPHRGPVAGRRDRRRRPPLRARLLAAAPPPEGDRDHAGAEPRPGAARPHLRRRRQVRPPRRLRQRRHRRVPARPGHGPLRVHRDEPADPGRAHRHRGDDRHRPRPRAAADRRRRDAREPRRAPARRSASAASRCSAASRPRTPPTASAPTPGASPPTARRAARASDWTRARPSSAPRSPRSSTRCW